MRKRVCELCLSEKKRPEIKGKTEVPEERLTNAGGVGTPNW